MKKLLVGLAVAVALVPMAIGGSASATPRPLPRKACSAYDRERFHGVTAHLPDGTKCLQVGEWCSHAADMQRAYREYGFICKPNERLAEL
jgi:hypothetical protein